MIKLSVMYPERSGARFDLDYYLNQHLALVRKHWGRFITDAYVSRGVSGGAPGTSPTYRIMAHVAFASQEDLQAAMAEGGTELIADIPNFTDITPVMQVSEVVS